MRAFLLGTAALIGLSSVAAAQQVIADVGLVRSESIRYDAGNDRYLVSNMGAQDVDNNGFIALMTPDGAIENLTWIAGGQNGVTLNDPRGMFVRDGTLYVADQKAVRMFDAATGEAKGEVAIEDATTLNDLWVTEDGTVYVTNSGSNDVAGAIYRIAADGTVSVFAERSPDLVRPNGITVLPDGNIVHGGRSTELFTRSPDGALVSQVTLPTGRFDGIIALEDGSLLVASQDGHNVYRIPAGGGDAVVVAEGFETPAAIGYDSMRNRVLVPQIMAGSVTIVELD